MMQNEFTIKMEASNVTKFFFLNLPSKFCKSYMPKKDRKVILEDDTGKETATEFKAKRHRLSGGWKGFVRDHALQEEDILVFRAIAPRRLKVKIYPKARPNASTETADDLAAADALTALSAYGSGHD